MEKLPKKYPPAADPFAVQIYLTIKKTLVSQ